jgi:hypothetical protein
MANPAPVTPAIQIGGTEYSLDRLTFREQLELRDLVRHVSGDPDASPVQALTMEFLPCLTAVALNRPKVNAHTPPEERARLLQESLEQALDLSYEDLEQPAAPKASRPPRKASKQA